MGVVTLSGQLASGLYAAHAAATASSPVAASFTGTSNSTMYDPPSGTSRIVDRPRTDSVQPAGAKNVLPRTVVLGASVAISSRTGSVVGTGSARTSAANAGCEIASAVVTLAISALIFMLALV